MSTPLVSIIIPTFNRSWGLRKAIDSVFDQTYSNFELIISDDASKDDTQAVVEAYCDPRIRSFKHDSNIGMVPNWGYGLSKATGEFSVFLGDDDILVPTFLQNRVQEFASKPEIVLVFSQFEVRDLNGELLHIKHDDWKMARLLSGMDFFKAALGRRIFIGSALYRTDVLRSTWEKIKDDDLVLDYGLNVRLGMSGSGVAAFIPVHDFIMTFHSGQNGQSKTSTVFQQNLACLDRIRLQATTEQRKMINAELCGLHLEWGRRLKSLGNVSLSRHHFLQGIYYAPLFYGGWTQYIKSFLW